jgi:hypothetical protein
LPSASWKSRRRRSGSYRDGIERFVTRRRRALPRADRVPLDLGRGAAVDGVGDHATVYGAAHLSYIIARDGELPAVLEKKLWNRPIEGLFITAGTTLAIANFIDLSSLGDQRNRPSCH